MVVSVTDGGRFKTASRGQTMADLAIAFAIFLAGIGIVVGATGGLLSGVTTVDGADTQPEAEAIAASLMTDQLGAAETPGHDRLNSEDVIAFFGTGDQEPLENVVPRSEDTGVFVTLRAVDTRVEDGPPRTFTFIAGQPFAAEVTREGDSFGEPGVEEVSSIQTATKYGILDGRVVELEVQTWQLQDPNGGEEEE